MFCETLAVPCWIACSTYGILKKIGRLTGRKLPLRDQVGFSIQGSAWGNNSSCTTTLIIAMVIRGLLYQVIRCRAWGHKHGIESLSYG